MPKSLLKKISLRIGKQLDLVQGAGGNISLKDDNTLWVKASGYWLADADNKDMFLPLNYSGIVGRMSKRGKDPVSSEIIHLLEYDKLRPSIETTLHALMPHRIVVHVHSVNVISLAVLQNAKEVIASKLDGMNWQWIPYARPGLPLTKEIQKVMHFNPDILILANHGLVIGADKEDEVFKLLQSVEEKMSRVKRKSHEINYYEVQSLLDVVNDYKLPKYSFCHSLAFDKISIDLINSGSLYPDHIIFLGSEPFPVLSKVSFLKKYSSKCTKNDDLPPFIVIKGVGVLVNKNLSNNAEEMLHCLTNVFLRIQRGEKVNYLTKLQEAELLGWDAEKYRKLIQR